MRLRLALSSLLIAAALPASADWLVTTDGSKIQTQAAWEVRGRLVLFHLPDGSLSSIQLDAVDLDASHEATLGAAREAHEAARAEIEAKGGSAKRSPVLVLTDRDVEHVDVTAPADDEPEEEVPTSRLVVTDWSEDTEARVDGVEITGTVRNVSAQTVMGAGLVVRVFDSEDALLATADAQFTARNLTPGAAANFRARFPAVYGFARVEFEPVGLGLETRPVEEADAPGVPALRERQSNEDSSS